jgi:hypothetical protein
VLLEEEGQVMMVYQVNSLLKDLETLFETVVLTHYVDYLGNYAQVVLLLLVLLILSNILLLKSSNINFLTNHILFLTCKCQLQNLLN